MKTRCFTLIELFIVIAVIAILAGMLMPALSRSRILARTIGCSANTKTIMTGMMLYADNHNQYLPFRDTQIGSDPTGRFWFQKIYGELTGDSGTNMAFYRRCGFFRCPAYQLAPNVTVSYHTIAYGKNDYIGPAMGGSITPVPLNKVKRPSVVIATGDSDDDAYYGMIIMGGDYPIGNRHAGKATAAFVDGHGEIVSCKDFLAPGVIYGSMDYGTGAMIQKSSSSAVGTTSWPLDLLYKWGARGGGYDYLVK